MSGKKRKMDKSRIYSENYPSPQIPAIEEMKKKIRRFYE
jgi:hypothetical protein